MSKCKIVWLKHSEIDYLLSILKLRKKQKPNVVSKLTTAQRTTTKIHRQMLDKKTAEGFSEYLLNRASKTAIGNTDYIPVYDVEFEIKRLKGIQDGIHNNM